MKLELKSIKYAAFASQETSCFEAKIYKDGKPWAYISNEGHGGCDNIEPITDPYNSPAFWAEVEAVNEALAMSHEGIMYSQEYGNDTVQITFDLGAWAAARLDDHLMLKDLKRDMSKNAIFIANGNCYMLGNGRKPDAALFASVMKRHPDARILNTMPPADALATLQRYA